MRTLAGTAFLAALQSGCLSPTELKAPEPPPDPELLLHCESEVVDSTWTQPDRAYPGHRPEHTECDVAASNLLAPNHVRVTVTPREVGWAATGESLTGAGGISGTGSCPATTDRLAAESVFGVAAGSAHAGFVCVACDTDSRGGLTVRAELLEEPYLEATVDLTCHVRDPNRFTMSLVADEANREGGEVPLLVTVGDHELGSLVAGELVLVRPPREMPRAHGLWGADEDGIIGTIVARDADAGVARPAPALSFLCPDTPGEWVLTAEFRDPRRNGMASDTTSLSCF